MELGIGHLAVLGTWATWFFWTGAVKGLAVLLPTLREQLDTYTWVIGWMIVISDATADLIGPIAAPLGRQLGIRTCVMASGLMLCTAFVIASFSSTLVMTIALATLAGPALGLSNVLCRELIGCCFSGKRIITAYAISQTGSPAGYIVFPVITQLFLDTYGWRGALLLLGSIFFHLVVCGAPLRSPSSNGESSEYALVSGGPTEVADQHVENGNEGGNQERQIYSALKLTLKNMNAGLLTDKPYWLVATVSITFQFAHLAWLIYFVPHAQAKGFTPTDAVVFTVIVGLSKLIALVVIGPLLAKLETVDTKVSMGTTLVFLTAYFLADPWMTSYWLNVIALIIYGLANGAALLLNDVLLCEIVGMDRLGSAFGWIAMKTGILRLSLLYVPGLLYDLLGDYTLAFMLMGGIHLFGIAALLLLATARKIAQR